MSRPIDDSFALFDDASWPDRNAVLFTSPLDFIEARTLDEVPAAIDRLDLFRASGLFVAGYFAYELGYCFEPRLKPLLPADHGPLLRFLAFNRMQHLRANDCTRWLLERVKGAALNSQTTNSESFQDYASNFDTVHGLIERGDVYQVNLTTRQQLRSEGDLFATYLNLKERSRAGACAFLHLHDESILSFSPETFFAVQNREIKVRPMKGTIARRPQIEDDLKQLNRLRCDPKQRAENLMIVDLMRNDLSRVCETGSVNVTDMFTVETYPTFHTLTSGVEGKLADDPAFATLLPALFPCGSVTGAPKIRAMEIIRNVERSKRGVYCGSIGFASGNQMNFNVAIRTLAVKGSEAVLGVGGGIVWDSDAHSEYDECALKAKFFASPHASMRLLETMRWTREEGIFLLERHLARLQRSSLYFGFRLDVASVRGRLEDAVRDQTDPSLVRLTLGVRGDCQIELKPLELSGINASWRYAVSAAPVNSDDVRLYHKTTRRDVYEEQLSSCRNDQEIDELVLVNERGEVTEGTRSNIFVDRQGVLLTPPISSGLLDGCFRRELIENGPRKVVEAVLHPKDLHDGTVWFGNSVRGMVRGVLVGTDCNDFSHATLPGE